MSEDLEPRIVYPIDMPLYVFMFLEVRAECNVSVHIRFIKWSSLHAETCEVLTACHNSAI